MVYNNYIVIADVLLVDFLVHSRFCPVTHHRCVCVCTHKSDKDCKIQNI